MRQTLIWLAATLISVSACAEETPLVTPMESEATESSANTPMVPSVIFVQYLNQQAPTLFCQQDPGIACLDMPTELCLASVEESQTRCGPELLQQWPASFAETQENAIKYAQEYRNCLLNDWVESFGLEPERLATCGISLD